MKWSGKGTYTLIKGDTTTTITTITAITAMTAITAITTTTTSTHFNYTTTTTTTTTTTLELQQHQLHYNYNYLYHYNYNYNYIAFATPHYTLQLWVRWPLQPFQKPHHFSVHQWLCSAIRASQHLTSPIVSYLWNFRHCLARYYW